MADCEQKFLEMKKYIPFLESTIQTLESRDKNPREPQLTKLKALRDLLLLDKNKRMKMDNLLKCEQVLINLHSKVVKANLIQADNRNNIKSEQEVEAPSDLETVRQKLKIVAKVSDSVNIPEDGSTSTSSSSLKNSNDRVHSLKSYVVPKVTVASEVRKVPLFERRPRRVSRSKSESPNRHRSLNSSDSVSSSSKTPRKYTRVLCSPDPESRWPQKMSPRKSYDDGVLFQRRSPRRGRSRSHSPRSRSNKKKSHKKDRPARPCDVNITLNVPEERLNSLNATDIFDRIVNCNEDDVDIKHLKELREQILKKLKQTGVKQDISEFILKSYKKKKKKPKIAEVEEGELSDSESESLEKIYGNLTDANLTFEVKKDKQEDNLLDNVKQEDVTSHLQTTSRIFEREIGMESPKIKISLLLSNTNQDNTNNLDDKNTAGVSKPTTTFLTDIINKESSEEECADASKSEIKKAPFFYDELQNEENRTENVKVTSTQDALPNETCTQTNKIYVLKSKELREKNQTAHSPSTANEIQLSDNKCEKERDNCSAINDLKGSEQAEAGKDELSSLKPDALVSENPQISSVHLIANSTEAVTKPKELCFLSNNSQTDEASLANLLYRDLSPLRASSNSKLPSIQKSFEAQDKSCDKSCEEKCSGRSKAIEANSDESLDRIEGLKSSQIIPFLSDEKGKEKDSAVISEIDILKALKNEILGEVVKVNDNTTETPSLHQPKISKVTDKSQLEADKKKRISIENYKAKAVPVQKASVGLFAKKAEKKQEDLLRKALTPRECERFQMILNNSLQDELSDDDTQIDTICLTGSELNEVTNLGPKSPEEENFIDSPTGSPILIPSDPIKCDASDMTTKTTKSDVDMRVIMPKISPQSTTKHILPPGNDCFQINPNKISRNFNFSNPSNTFSCDFPLNANYKGKHPTPLLAIPINKPSPLPHMAPSRDGSMTPSRQAQMNAAMAPTIIQTRNSTMTPLRNPSMTPSRNPSMTPSRGLLMTPTYSPMYGDDSFNNRGHVYAPSDLPDPIRTPTWDRMSSPVIRDDGSATPVWKADTTRGGSIMRDVPRISVWDSDIRSPITDHAPDFGYVTPSHEPFTKPAEHLDPYYSSNNDCFPNRSRSGRDPRLCIERKDEFYHRDPRNLDVSHGNRISYHYDFDASTKNFSPNFNQETNQRRDLIGNTSVAQESYRSLDPFSEGRFTRERSVGRNFSDEPKFNQGYSEDSYSYNRDPREDRYFVRASSVGRNIARECISSRTVQVPISTINMSGQQNFDRNMRGTSMGRESNFGQNKETEASVGRNMYSNQDDRENMGREVNVGRDTGHVPCLERNRAREPSIGRNMSREVSVGRNIGLEPSLERNRARESSIGRNVCREPSRGRSIGREPSMEKSRPREASLSRNIDRERLDNFDNNGERCSDNKLLKTSFVRKNIENYGFNKTDQSNSRILGSNSRDPRNRRDLHDSKSRHISTEQRHSIETSSSQGSFNASSPRKDNSNANNYHHRSKCNSKTSRHIKDKTDYKQRDDKSKDKNISITEGNKQSGVVYTSDNIAKGNILEPGYGVKNYKIPKIKRAIEDIIKPNLIQNNEITDKTNVDNGKNKHKREDIKNIQSISSLKQVSQKRNKLPQTKQVTRRKDGSNISSMTSMTKKSKPGLAHSMKTNQLTDSEDSNEFDEILTKIKQSQAEVSSDTDESLQEHNSLTNTTRKLKSESSVVNVKHTDRLSADNINIDQESRPSANENQTEGSVKKILLKNEHISHKSITCSDLDKNDLLDNTVNSKIHPDTKRCSVKLTKSALSCVQIERFGQNVVARIANQSKEITDTGIKELMTANVVLANEQSSPKATTVSDLPESAKLTLTSQYGASKPQEPMVSESCHCLETRSMHENDQNDKKLQEYDIPQRLTVQDPKKDSNGVIQLESSAPRVDSQISTDNDKNQQELKEHNVPKLILNQDLNKDDNIRVIHLESSATTVESKMSVDNHKNQPDMEEHVSKPILDQDLKNENKSLNFESSTPGIATDQLQITKSLQITTDNIEPTYCNDKEEVNIKEKCSQIEKLAGEEKVSGKESELNSKLLTTMPDSTMKQDGIEDTAHENVFPDSTNNSDIHTDVSSVVSSSHDVSKELNKEIEDATCKKDKVNAVESLNTILSLLQDKSKIKQILAMLSDESAETEKLKKRLSKLSQLESDDEDVAEAESSTVSQKKISKFVDKPMTSQTDSVKFPDKDSECKSTTDTIVDSLTNVSSIFTTSESAESTKNVNAQENIAVIGPLAGLAKEKVVVPDNNKVSDMVTAVTKGTVAEEIVVPKIAMVVDQASVLAIDKETNLDAEQPITPPNIFPNQVADPQGDAVSEKVEAREHIGVSSDTEENKTQRSGTIRYNHASLAKDIIPEPADSSKTFVDQNKPVKHDSVSNSPRPCYKKKKIKITSKKIRCKNGKIKKSQKKTSENALINEKRMTRSESAQKVQVKKKQRSRELQKLHEDIRDMFISEDVLNATGLRMCRLAKLADDSSEPVRSESEERLETKTKSAAKKGNKSVSEHSRKEGINVLSDPKPLVVIEKSTLINTDLSKNIDKDQQEDKHESPPPSLKIRKKPGPKPKPKVIVSTDRLLKGETKRCKVKSGPKSKKIVAKNVHGNNEMPNTSSTNKSLNVSKESLEKSFDSDEESLSSLASIVGSDRILDSKSKPKKKSMLWKLGIIKCHKKKAKNVKENASVQSCSSDSHVIIPDYNCFTDKSYCFEVNTSKYRCRICVFEGENIVLHYKQKHPHCEVPLSRINPKTAVEAIEQSHTTDFDRFSKKHRTKIICRFCFLVFESPKLNLEKFFWHVVSKHTGEYKYPCYECTDSEKCTTALDIPSPPEPTQALLLGFICGECHYTQISLNNLKTHVALRHDNEETEVYTVNLCDIPPELLGKRSNMSVANKKELGLIPQEESTRKLRSKREKSLSESSDASKPNKSLNERTTKSKHQLDQQLTTSPARKKVKRTRPMITYESDSNDDTTLLGSGSEAIKSEVEDTDAPEEERVESLRESLSRRGSDASEAAIVWENAEFVASLRKKQTIKDEPIEHDTEEPSTPIEYDKSPHFMITAPKVGVKSSRSYACRIKGCRNDYRTTLLISLKKHVQFKHVAWRDFWDGYCCVCNQVVGGGSTRQSGSYSDCLNHMLMKHLDHFPVLQEPVVNEMNPADRPVGSQPSLVKELSEVIAESTSKNYINVRPLSDMISTQSKDIYGHETSNGQSLPRVGNFGSLQSATESVQTPSDRPQSSLTSEAPVAAQESEARHSDPLPSPVNAINKVLAEKHPAVRESTLTSEKLAAVYKCAGKYCAFVGRTVASYLEHLHAHLQVKRDNGDVLRCAYCGFSSEVAEPLAEHVLREHGHVRFSCRYCWYVATAPPLVELHSARTHSDRTIHAPLPIDSQILDEAASTRGMLTRADAVPFYTCSQRDPTRESEPCAFRTYTSPKYREHLECHHKDDAWLSCFMCKRPFGRPNGLIAHLKLHGLCLFQCTYCLYGADTELEMLQHAAEHHPSRRPQSYLRHILEPKDPLKKNNKKILPLMRLDKEVSSSTILGTVPFNINDNATKEVERATALERLVLQHAEPARSPLPPSCLAEEMETNDAGSPLVEENSVTPATNQNESPVVVPQIKVKVEPFVEQAKHSINTSDERKKTSDEYIICLDSDEEEKPSLAIISSVYQTKAGGTSEIVKHFKHGDVIDLSDDDSSAPIEALSDIAAVAPSAAVPSAAVSSAAVSSAAVSPAVTSALPSVNRDPLATSTPSGDAGPRFGPDQMFKCQRCQEICKNDYYYRQHLLKCYPNQNAKPQCPHCDLVVECRKDIRFHLIQAHGPVKSYRCSICNLEDRVSKKITQHMNVEHNVLFTTICLENPGTNLAIMRYSVKPEEGKTMSTTSAKGPRAPPPPSLPVSPKAKPVSKNRIKPGPKSKQVGPKPIPRFGPEDMDRLPLNPILDEYIQCSRCEFGTKVRSNMIRHLQMHASTIAVPSVAPVNPVPHLESNEMHFDKMTNLAASSNVLRSADRSTALSSPETASKYPKYVPEKDRNFCFAVGCSYMSLDESLLKYHWETLHTGLTHGSQATTYRCVHCPPNQQMDMSRPVTASRIIAHLKMHDATLYGCRDCNYYHYQRAMIERHVAEKHDSNPRSIFSIRKPADSSPTVPAVDIRNAPTMDLKPWQCGVCKFKSMLRPEVAEHCSKSHGFKFQFKCSFCPYSGSVQTSVFRHQVERHSGRVAEDVIYAYYKEHSLPADEESCPLWTKQRSFLNLSNETVKAEDEGTGRVCNTKTTTPAEKSPPLVVDLAIVKSEVEEATKEDTVEEVITRFGPFCEPKDLLYSCPLCTVATESKEAMVSHLHEELNYRKWGCTMCPYKAFSKSRLMEHSSQEHKQTPEPTQLAIDRGVEMWVEKIIEHQERAININKAAIKALEGITDASLNKSKVPLALKHKDSNEDKQIDIGLTVEAKQELEKTFGPFGLPNGDDFVCPKCDFKSAIEDMISQHLEIELARVRWACSQCSIKFQHYHEAQKHCSTEKHSSFAHVSAVSKDPSQRASWIQAVILTQRMIKNKPRAASDGVVGLSADKNLDSLLDFTEDNSLLVERYAEEIPGPSHESDASLNQPLSRKRKALHLQEDDSDEEMSQFTISDEKLLKCPHCDYTTRWKSMIRTHKLRHFNLQSHRCGYCPFMAWRSGIKKHVAVAHRGQPYLASAVKIPEGSPPILGWLPKATRRKKSELVKEAKYPENKSQMKAPMEDLSHVCLLCDEELRIEDAPQHQAVAHIGLPQQIEMKGTVVRKCGACMVLCRDPASLQQHHDATHAGQELNYSYFKVGFDKRLFYACGHCNHNCRFLQDLKCHHNTVHATAGLTFKPMRRVYKAQTTTEPGIGNLENDEGKLQLVKRKKNEDAKDLQPSIKRVAKKSTTRLPYSSKATARKSTTKLPFHMTGNPLDMPSDEEEDYSYYGTKPTPVGQFGHMKTKMPFYDTMMPTTVKQLGEIVNICPYVLVSDVNKKFAT